MRYLLLLALAACARADAHPPKKQKPCVTIAPPPPTLGAWIFDESLSEKEKQEVLDQIHAMRRWADATWMACGPS